MLYLCLSLFLIGTVSTDEIEKSSATEGLALELNQEILAVKEIMKGWSRQLPTHALLTAHEKGIIASQRLMKRWTGKESLGRSRLSHWIQFQSNMHTLECDNPEALDSSELVYCSCNDFFSGVIADDASVDSFFANSNTFTERRRQAEAVCSDRALFSCRDVAFEIAAEYEWFLTNQGNQTDTASNFCANVVASAAESPNNPPCAMATYDLLRAYAQAQGDWVDYPAALSATGFEAVFNNQYPDVSFDDVRNTENIGDFCQAIGMAAIFVDPATE